MVMGRICMACYKASIAEELLDRQQMLAAYSMWPRAWTVAHTGTELVRPSLKLMYHSPVLQPWR